MVARRSENAVKINFIFGNGKIGDDGLTLRLERFGWCFVVYIKLSIAGGMFRPSQGYVTV